jgi:serine/threonine-protein kinase
MAEPMHDDDPRFGGRSFAETLLQGSDVEDDDDDPSEAPADALPKSRYAVRDRYEVDAPESVRPRSSRGSTPPASLVGGKYRIERIVVQDGPVVEAQASHEDLGQTVTVKYLTTEAARKPDAVARFLRGARAVAHLSSEHVVRVLDVGRFRSGVPYVVTEAHQGWPLEEVLRVRGPLPVQEAVEYVLQACEAIAEAHSLGLVHGSLNLGSLVLTRRPDESPLVKVQNLGLARGIELGETSDGSLAGPPRAFLSALPYLSPEQIRGSEDIDERTDVWALGTLLHALLAGAPVFRARSAVALLAAIAADDPTPLGALRDDVAADLEGIVLACLAKEPSGRTSTVAELAEQLKPYASGDALASVDRVMRLSGRGTRPPPLPVPKTRSIVPTPRVASSKKTAAAPAKAPAPAAPPPAPAPAAARSPGNVALTALVGVALGVAAATIPWQSIRVEVAPPVTQSAPVAPNMPAIPPPQSLPATPPTALVAALAGPAEIVPAVAQKVTPVLAPALAAPALARAPVAEAPAQAPAMPAPVSAPKAAAAPSPARASTSAGSSSTSAKAPAHAAVAAAPGKDLFDDVR